MRLAYVSTADPTDPRAWSGTIHGIAQSLSDNGADLHPIGPLRDPLPLLFKGRRWLTQRLTGRGYLRDRQPFVLRAYAQQVAQQLRGRRVDCVFSPGTVPVAYLQGREPLAFWTDATFAGLVDFYPEFSHLTAVSLRDGHRAEAAALRRARLALYSSEWAARTAIDHYGADPAKVHVVPFGANFTPSTRSDEIDGVIAARAAGTAAADRACTLLFLGVDWRRKGGDIALAVTRRLREQGIPARLVVAGCTPPEKAMATGVVQSLGFIAKHTADGAHRFEQLLAESHFLVLPSRADCTPIVFCEANALALPVITTDVGGMTTTIRHGENGATFPLRGFVPAAAAFIAAHWSQPDRYRDLARTAHHAYETRLNWQVAGRDAMRLLREAV